jgi:hypothetical protein
MRKAKMPSIYRISAYPDYRWIFMISLGCKSTRHEKVGEPAYNPTIGRPDFCQKFVEDKLSAIQQNSVIMSSNSAAHLRLSFFYKLA